MGEQERGAGWWKASDGEWYPPRWEYRWAVGYHRPRSSHIAIDALLAELGSQGWEAVNYSGAPNDLSPQQVSVLMKRMVRP